MKKVIAVAVVVVAGAGIWFAVRPSAPVMVALDPPVGQPSLALIKPDPNAFPTPEPNQTVFDLTYRGLPDGKDPLFMRSFWGYGNSPGKEEPPFIRALRDKGIEPLHLVYNPNCKGAEWSAVQLCRKKPAAFYMDLDANGKVTSNERMLPTPGEWTDSIDFITPDFCMTTQSGAQVPYRLLLRTQPNGSEISCMWAGACVLEGESVMEGRTAKVALCGYGPSGEFDTYGRTMCRLEFREGSQVTTSFENLSSLVLQMDQMYRLRVHSNVSRGAVRVVLAKDTSPRGKLILSVDCQNDKGAEIKPARVQGRDGTTFLLIRNSEQELPVGQYTLDGGSLGYAAGESMWRCDFQRGPGFEIVAGQDCKIRVGQPKVSVLAIPEEKRYSGEAKPQTVFRQGTKIYVTREVRGVSNETYGRFSRRNDKDWYEDVKPQVRITDAVGGEVLAQSMEYG